MKNYRIVIVLLVSVALVLGCGKRELNQYRLVDPGGELFMVVRNDSGVIVGPKVTQWATHDHYMILNKVPYIEEDGMGPYAHINGYLIINTISGDIDAYQTKVEFHDRLSTLGIATDIPLKDVPGPL